MKWIKNSILEDARSHIFQISDTIGFPISLTLVCTPKNEWQHEMPNVFFPNDITAWISYSNLAKESVSMWMCTSSRSITRRRCSLLTGFAGLWLTYSLRYDQDMRSNSGVSAWHWKNCSIKQINRSSQQNYWFMSQYFHFLSFLLQA